ncbi:MAG: T9SS type A sorting domain-containing protein, partial [Bacteroidetes bacterium]|nr:T9SS type A sorting domain-containing protein [Bacteroidota bacterium]
FDEEIEENTLATNDCYIADGSGHGGLSTGALIARDGIEMTVWTDPNYGAVNSSTTAGLYLHDPYTTSAAGYYGLLNEGSIIFNANGLELDVTPSSIYGHTHLYTFPVSRFDVASGVTDGGKVNVGPGGLWDFFGAASPSKLVPGVTTLTGSSSGPTYAGLTVHGGAIYPGQSITGSYADVEIFYEQNISPMNTTTTANSNKTGLFEILNDGNSLDYCKVNAYVPPVSSLILDQVVMKILGISTASYPTTSLSSYYTDYTNSGTGAATIQYNVPGYTTAPSFAAFYGGTSSRTDFSINEPINGSSISNMTFDNFFLPIIVNRSASLSSDYGGVTISGNTFEHYSGITVPPGFLICGISVINCNTPTSYKSLWIDNNVFATSNTNLQSAIFLENTTGNVVSNVITASGWRFGIQNIGSTTITPVPKTKAYLCNNIIQNANHDGIVSSFYEGYIKLCRISGCDEGYSSGVTDNPKIIFSSLLSNTNTGLESASNTSFIDLSGLHGSISGSDDAAAFDTIQSNASGLSSSGVGQVSLVNGGYVKYSNDNPVVSWWTQWGRNNTIASSGDPLLISTVSGTAALGLIDNNYWGGDDPSTATGTQPGAMSWDGTNTNSNGISFTADSGGTLFSLQGRPFSVDCGGAFTSSHGIGDDQPTKVQKVVDLDSCQRLKQWEAGQPQTEEEYQMRYDSLKRYVESCASTDSMSYQAFGFLYGSVSNIHTDDSTRWNSFREWLISVLYLNTTNPHYFCACLTTMIGTYGVEPYRIANAGIAIEKFLIADSNCDDQGLRDQLQFDIDARYNTWLRNGAVPGQLDTIDPSLDTLGLGFLLTRSVNDPLPSVAGLGLGACSSSPNPFTQELAVNFMLNRMTYVTVSIYDPLGRMVWGDGKGRSLDAGVHTIRIDGTGLPSGTLYARISTGFGEVKTVKLVHQE